MTIFENQSKIGIPNKKRFRRIVNRIIGKGTIRTSYSHCDCNNGVFILVYATKSKKKVKPAIFTSVWIICLSQSVILNEQLIC